MRAARRALLALVVPLLVPAPAHAQVDGRVPVLVLEVVGLGYREALADPVIGALARSGGIGLLVGRGRGVTGLVEEIDHELGSVRAVRLEGSAQVGDELADGSAAVTLVLVVGSPEAETEPRPVVMASGPPEDLLAGRGPIGGLTSKTTGVHGLVAEVDVSPTIAKFQGAPRPDDMPGSPIRIEGEAPTDLYERAVDYRRVAAPIGLAVLALGIGSLVVGVLVLLIGIASRVARTSLAVLGLYSVALLVVLIPASVLPSLEPPVLVPALLLMGGLLLTAALVAGRGDHALAVIVVAGAGLAVLVVDALLGWPTEVTPLLGGGALLGVRFYGLGNSAAGIVLAGAVLTATRLRPWAGVGLIGGAALFAGLPFLGADLGGGVTLFAVAGLWYGWRVRGRLDLPAAGFALGAALVGGAVIVAAHSLWPVASHVARAVEAGGLLQTFLDRLASSVRSTTEIWPAWLTVLGLPAWLLVAWRRSGPFRASLDRGPWWRAGVIVLVIGGMIGYVLNDTFGTAAIAFVFVSAAMVYPALRERWTSG